MGTAVTKRGVVVKQFGLTALYQTSSPAVDIVFVHGLNGSSYHTWATKKSPEVFWPSDLLPEALRGVEARIITYGYDANVTSFSGGTSKDKLHNHAEHLISSLCALRNSTKSTERPIVFVCHSLGGLVVKKALCCYTRVSHQYTQHLRSIYISTYGILFLGTPHNGSSIARTASTAQSIISTVIPKWLLSTSPQLVQVLQSDNEHLQVINREFVQIMNRFHIYFFHESKPMDIGSTRAFIVEESSAAPVWDGVERMGIEADHGAMCRFADKNSPGYDTVTEAIRRYASTAGPTIVTRWQQAKQEYLLSVQAGLQVQQLNVGSTLDLQTDAHDPLDISTHSLPGPHDSIYTNPDAIRHANRPLLLDQKDETVVTVSPPGFHPNSVFLGMQDEMDQLRKVLSDERKRAQGPVAVLIHGGPGCGKSHLARQYMYDHETLYPGGIFWIDGKSKESRLNGIWEIAVAASILLEDQKDRDPRWLMAHKYTANVKRWLESRDNWLLVFDGLAFEVEEDLDEFRNFLPFKPNTSIIYTSVDRTLRQKQRLYEPYGLGVQPLAVDAACQLLFCELGISNASPRQAQKARELVKYYECLPLAIHALGHRLNASGKPLETYQPGSHLTDLRLAEPYRGIMTDLSSNEYTEALQLIYILSFFGHNVPVGMIHLGRKALAEYKVEIRTLERYGSTERHIDNTFAILIRYGLIERSFDAYTELAATPTSEIDRRGMERRPTDPASSQGASSHEGMMGRPRTEIDVLKIHSVVQGFCRDELIVEGAKHFWYWLGIATSLFCLSYKNATTQIRAVKNAGLVRDYREYQTHAKRLMRHYRTKLDKSEVNLELHHDCLKKMLLDIEEEIRHRSPGSSQEWCRHQRSIFDHTNSMSSFSDSIASTSTKSWERELGTDCTDSPLEIGSPQSIIQPDSVFHGNINVGATNTTQDIGTDNVSAVDMSPSLSNNTVVPTPKIPQEERVSTPAKKRGSFLSAINAIKEPLKKLKEQRKNLGEIRPATPTVSVSDGSRRDSSIIVHGSPSHRKQSDAESANKPTSPLAQQQVTASSPTNAGTSASPAQARPGPANQGNQGPSYAAVASGTAHAGTKPPPRPKHPSMPPRPMHKDSPPIPDAEEIKRLSASMMGGTEMSLSLSTHSDPGLPYPRRISGSDRGSPTTPHSPFGDHDYQRPPIANQQHFSDSNVGPTFMGPNPLPMPYEPNVQITQMPPRRSSAITPPLRAVGSRGSLPHGYSSQPMTREHSGLSHQSLQAETGRFASRSSSSSAPRAASFSHSNRGVIIPTLDTRMRYPASECAVESATTTPTLDESQSLPQPSILSGPGFMVDSGDGISRSLIEFNVVQYTPQIRFGELDPVNVDAARQRTDRALADRALRQEQLIRHARAQALAQAQAKAQVAPYPDRNMMPTASDPQQLAAMMQPGFTTPQQRAEQVRQEGARTTRLRSGSTPQVRDWTGLGINHRSP
ncbi:LipA and NB-ARC domain-containing protein [Nannizzia gypsea CBS 118893]|uniref:LipA and NB-ARC domain-containing protein n=1 Tax=Arthroderma gypseum (strain ATCC MYA-4604 / CBS 118893) TaxID=535722 RepID=E4UNK6_ARTGP|nr:LipA and NB-ARC domain-containing protein [Nannizzia gypsea CBS 118893]EFQ99614.1 LipA and NB-ARC domain-containing protein [Nannizzia gypsea CBS 118893]